MRMMSNRVTVYVPAAHLKAATTAVHALTKNCGGCTHDMSNGSYIGNDGREHNETIAKFTWWYGGHIIREVEHGVQDLVAALLTAGEECVMVEWLTGDRRGSHHYSELHTLADMEN